MYTCPAAAAAIFAAFATSVYTAVCRFKLIYAVRMCATANTNILGWWYKGTHRNNTRTKTGHASLTYSLFSILFFVFSLAYWFVVADMVIVCACSCSLMTMKEKFLLCARVCECVCLYLWMCHIVSYGCGYISKKKKNSIFSFYLN